MLIGLGIAGPSAAMKLQKSRIIRRHEIAAAEHTWKLEQRAAEHHETARIADTAPLPAVTPVADTPKPNPGLRANPAGGADRPRRPHWQHQPGDGTRLDPRRGGRAGAKPSEVAAQLGTSDYGRKLIRQLKDEGNSPAAPRPRLVATD